MFSKETFEDAKKGNKQMSESQKDRQYNDQKKNVFSLNPLVWPTDESTLKLFIRILIG